MATPDQAHFETLLKAQLVLLKIEQRAPEVLKGLKYTSLVISKTSPESITNSLNDILGQVVEKSPALAEEAKGAADAAIAQIK
jgi:hypothetical protein